MSHLYIVPVCLGLLLVVIAVHQLWLRFKQQDSCSAMSAMESGNFALHSFEFCHKCKACQSVAAEAKAMGYTFTK